MIAAAMPTAVKESSKVSKLTRIAASTLVALALVLAAAPAAHADFGIANFDGQNSEQGGATYTQAGGHPFEVSTEINFNSHLETIELGTPVPPFETLEPDEPIKDVNVAAPPGLVGNPTVIPQCTMAQIVFDESELYSPTCPATTQIGTATVIHDSIFEPFVSSEQLPLYNMVPPPGVPARFAFNAITTGVVVVYDAKLRSGPDYGVSVDVRNASEGIALLGTTLTLWGVPADPAHDPERNCPGKETPGRGGFPASDPQCPSQVSGTELPQEAFLRMPTSCAGPLQTTAHTDSWANPGALNPSGEPLLSDPNWKSASYLTHEPPGLPGAEFPGLDPSQWGAPVGNDGCEAVPFEPQIEVQPSTEAADSPAGLSVELSLPQSDDPEAISSADLRRAALKLPAGMSVNPASASGLGACSPAQIALDSSAPANCPDSSKIGTVQIDTPLLDHPVPGAIYLAKQAENPFNSLLALYIAARDPETGVVVKLAGKVIADEQSGQLETVFDDQPQLPFQTLHVDLFSGPTAPLLTPSHCGTYTAEARLTPWSGGPPVELQSSFEISAGPGGQPCPPKPAPFAPKLSAGTQSPLAGAFSPFSLRLTREDGTQRLTALAVSLPKGLVGKLAGIPYCPDAALSSIPSAEGSGAAQLASPSCPAASQVGSVTVGAGAGPNPFFVQTGKAYLAGPYKGAPLSLAIATPALAGPFDLGNVLVRTALRVNPETAQVSAVSDPLPQILDGIPLDLRDVRVNIDRPSFTLNPTNCDPMAIEGTVGGSEGATAALSERFQVGECARLPFKPRLRLSLSGATRRGGFPALRATLRMPKATNANIAKAVVSLPRSEFLAQSHIRTICTRVQFAANSCPKRSVYGHARAFTPLLDSPLEGPVYLRSSSNPLPDLVADLKGQIHVALIGRIDSAKGGGIRTTFASVPDAPVSKFTLTMQGGRKSLLENSRGLCRSTNRATALFDAQSGKVRDLRPVVRAKGCGERGRRG